MSYKRLVKFKQDKRSGVVFDSDAFTVELELSVCVDGAIDRVATLLVVLNLTPRVPITRLVGYLHGLSLSGPDLLLLLHGRLLVYAPQQAPLYTVNSEEKDSEEA